MNLFRNDHTTGVVCRVAPCGSRWVENAYWYNNNDGDNNGDDNDDDDIYLIPTLQPQCSIAIYVNECIYNKSRECLFGNYVILTVCSILTNLVDDETHTECEIIFYTHSVALLLFYWYNKSIYGSIVLMIDT